MNQEQLTLRQLLEFRIQELWKELNSLREVIERMEKFTVVRAYEIDNLKLQMAGLAESLHDMEIRVIALEKHASLATWITRQVITVVFIAALIALLGYFR